MKWYFWLLIALVLIIILVVVYRNQQAKKQAQLASNSMFNPYNIIPISTSA